LGCQSLRCILRYCCTLESGKAIGVRVGVRVRVRVRVSDRVWVGVRVRVRFRIGVWGVEATISSCVTAVPPNLERGVMIKRRVRIMVKD
jgi:hypothetical protein